MKRYAMIAAALGTSVTLAACGNNDPATTGAGNSANPNPSASASAVNHNATDVTFAQDMIPHHRQAVEMAGMALDRASTPEVRALADKILAAQEPEIETMSAWLESWGEDVPAVNEAGGGHGAGHGADSSMDMPGMMSGEDMNQMMSMSGAAFDKMFLASMVEHHRGAIEMAEIEQAEGQYGPAKELAAKIAADQQAEITQMTSLLDNIG